MSTDFSVEKVEKIERCGGANSAQKRVGASRKRGDPGRRVPRTARADRGGGGWVDPRPRNSHVFRHGRRRSLGWVISGKAEPALHPRSAADRRETGDVLQQLLRVRLAKIDRR